MHTMATWSYTSWGAWCCSTPHGSSVKGGSRWKRLAHVQLACSIWSPSPMIDFPIGELLDDSICTIWLEHHLHPRGLVCPHCGSSARRVFRAQGHFPAYRCRACEGYYTLLTGTVFEKTRQRPATLVWL